MDPITLLFGIVALAYGVYTLWARAAKPESFGKLQSMQSTFGKAAGTFIHFIMYTVVPIVAGIIALILAFQGKSFF